MDIEPTTITNLIYFVLGLLAGATAPTYYATERLRGFGRAIFAKLPYETPPGYESEDEALQEAVDEENSDGNGENR